MNKMYVVIILASILFSCTKHRSDIEVIPNNEWEYLGDDQVTESAIPINENFEENLKETLLQLAKNWYERNGNKDGFYSLRFTIFIGESGRVDKIKNDRNFIIKNLIPKKQKHPADTLQSFAMDDEVVNEIIPIVDKWEFTPANFIGVTTKYKKSFGAIYRIESDERISLLHSRLDFLPNYTKDFFVAVEEMPSPIGGIKSIQEKVHYPEIAKRAGIEGRVFVKAYINENGDVVETEILKGIGAGCDEAAFKAVEATKFIPGKQKGKPVKVQVTVPILFKLREDKFEGSSKIYGEWEGMSNKGEEIKISFYNDGTTNLYKSKSGIMDGKRTGATFWPNYIIDSSSIPYKLDLNIKEQVFSKALLKFITIDSINIGRSNNKNIRPTNFSSENVYELWELKRIK